MNRDDAEDLRRLNSIGHTWDHLARVNVTHNCRTGNALRKQVARALRKAAIADFVPDTGTWTFKYEPNPPPWSVSDEVPPLQYVIPGTVKALVIPDLQVRSGVDLEHIRWAGQYAAHIKPDVIAQLGDWTDYQSISTYNSPLEREGMRLIDDHAATVHSLELFKAGLGEFKPKLQIITLGNHEDRLRRFVEDHPELQGTLQLPPFADYGWVTYPFLQPVEINGVLFCHYFTRTAKGWAGKNPHANAQTMTRREMRSCVAGHSPSLDTYVHPTSTGLIRGTVAGSFYSHDEAYQGPQGNRCWRGVLVLHQLKDGMYSLMEVSLEYMRGRYAR